MGEPQEYRYCYSCAINQSYPIGSLYRGPAIRCVVCDRKTRDLFVGVWDGHEMTQPPRSSFSTDERPLITPIRQRVQDKVGHSTAL